MTNLERIKAMSIDEMTEYLYKVSGCLISDCSMLCAYESDPRCRLGEKSACINGIKQWLESEVQQ